MEKYTYDFKHKREKREERVFDARIYKPVEILTNYFSYNFIKLEPLLFQCYSLKKSP